jgi:hypothetical protein
MSTHYRAPQWITSLLATEFTPSQLETIAANWYRYWQGSASNSDKHELVAAGRAMLMHAS